MAQPTIIAQNLNHFYGDGHLRRQILYDVSLEIQPGEIVIMTGPSGSGKTTLLTLIGGLRDVQEGHLEVLGQTMSGVGGDRLKLIRRQIGFIFQDHNLLSSLNAIRNVEIAAALYHSSKKQLQGRAQRVLEAVGLGKYLYAQPDQLSGGQKQRVAIARALVNEPRVILADEPTASLDGKTGREVVELMQVLAKQQGCTIVLVTHDNRILDIADRIISLEDGRLSTEKGEFLLNLSNLTSFIAETQSEDIQDLVKPLSVKQFDAFLGKLNTELKQIVSTVDLLNNRSFEQKLQTTLQAISLKLGQILQAEQVTFFVADYDKQTLWSKNAIGKNRELISIEIPINAGIAGYVAQSGEVVNIPDAYQDERFNPQIDKDSGFRTRNILCLPIKNDQEQVIAVVQALNKQAGTQFEEQDELNFFQLTRSLDFTIQSSVVYAQNIRRNSLESTLESDLPQLQKKISKYSSDRFIKFLRDLNQEFIQLLESGSTFASRELKTKVNGLFRVISFKISQVLEAEYITLFILSPNKESLRTDHALDQYGEPFTIEISINDGVVGYVARTGESVMINNPYEDQRFYDRVDQEIGYQTRHIMSLPIFVPNTQEVVAVVHALNKTTNKTGFTTQDQENFTELIEALDVVLQVSITSLRSTFSYTSNNPPKNNN